MHSNRTVYLTVHTKTDGAELSVLRKVNGVNEQNNSSAARIRTVAVPIGRNVQSGVSIVSGIDFHNQIGNLWNCHFRLILQVLKDLMKVLLTPYVG